MFRLFSYLFKYSPGLLVIAMATSITLGVTNTTLIALINAGIDAAGKPDRGLIIKFMAVCAILPLIGVFNQVLMSYVGQRSVYDLRLHLSRQILATPLRRLEKLGSGTLFAALTGDASSLSAAILMLPILTMNVTILIGCNLYLYILFWPAGLIITIATIVSLVLFELINRSGNKALALVRDEQDTLFEHFKALTMGIKEFKLHSERRNSFVNDLLHSSAWLIRQMRIRASGYFAFSGNMGQISFFVAIGFSLFFLPGFAEIPSKVFVGYTLVLLYLISPLGVITSTVPALVQGSVILQKLDRLGISLNEVSKKDDTSAFEFSQWKQIELRGVTHQYNRENEDESFCMGPINLTFKPGELVFIVGGNGSGKTTLAKLILGLYHPEGGAVYLDGQEIDPSGRENYRQLFSAVFADFFLHEHMLGLQQVDLDEKAREYLKILHLDKKVKVQNGVLSTIDLSKGQRKRLTLLNAYLEDRSFYLFDEWAADQDPDFKDVFYRSLLPELKRRNKTVVVISHDDRYFPLADRMIKLEFGQIISDEPQIPEL